MCPLVSTRHLDPCSSTKDWEPWTRVHRVLGLPKLKMGLVSSCVGHLVPQPFWAGGSWETPAAPGKAVLEGEEGWSLELGGCKEARVAARVAAQPNHCRA